MFVRKKAGTAYAVSYQYGLIYEYDLRNWKKLSNVTEGNLGYDTQSCTFSPNGEI